MIAGVIAFCVLIGVLLIPVGVNASYDSDGAFLRLIIGPLRLQLYPGNRRTNKKRKSGNKTTASSETSKRSAKTGGSFSELEPFLRIIYDLLCDFRRKLRVDRLEFKLVLAGEDPCDLSVNYGRAWAALGNVMPQLERFWVIRKRNLDIVCDYLADETTVTLLIDLTMTVGRLLCLAIRYGLRGLIEYRKLLNIRKGGA